MFLQDLIKGTLKSYELSKECKKNYTTVFSLCLCFSSLFEFAMETLWFHDDFCVREKLIMQVDDTCHSVIA